MIRPARPDDLAAIREILNAEILGGTASWTETPKTEHDIARWYGERCERGCPVLVAELDGRVAGYASYGPFRPGEGYRPACESTVYVAKGHRRRGVARALMRALIETARTAGLRRMAGWVSADQTASLALHERLGFERMARLDGLGCKHGMPLDGCLMMLRLDAGVQ